MTCDFSSWSRDMILVSSLQEIAKAMALYFAASFFEWGLWSVTLHWFFFLGQAGRKCDS